ncbi:HTH-type transcriptional regulator DmlR [Pigmentiphaga humi]|uniref:HTH-type transcriptional regulator DmlR n=1 Tax=Pigmentiphaga humi TaxID=2478468 RepID=A0A3P4AXH4_9BURK|nr:LysR family transcriptional regulator [Pigmentiphaga humi]VCU68717.1 HTH-type transcriptional regulator DmlR [Pigmentiphaga humi]
MDRLTEMALFVGVAEAGSLNRAAGKLGLSNAAASRYLSALEERLGARLVERNTRRLYLTEPGQEFLRRSKQILADLQEAESTVNAAVAEPSGMLQLAAPLFFCVHHIAPLLPAYALRCPAVSVQVQAVPDTAAIDGDVDVAIRMRASDPGQGVEFQRLAETRQVLAASPRYLKRAGMPRRPADLAAHALLIHTCPEPEDELHFTRRGEKTAVPVKGGVESNDVQVLRTAALDGLGIAILPAYVLYDDLVGGQLRPVLDAWDLPRTTIDLVYPSRKHRLEKVRTFVDFMAARFARTPYERRWTRRFKE